MNQYQVYRAQGTAALANVVALPKMGYERLALRIRHGGVRLKLGLLLGVAFFSLVGLPALAAVTTSRAHRLPALAIMTTTDAHESIAVYRWNAGTVIHVPLSEYLVNVLAAEMSPRAPMAALQAAAIAARTYAVRSTQRQLFATPTFAQAHGADVTDNGILDLPWLNAAQQQARFGSQTNADTVRYEQAVASTDGQVLTYQGEPILAFSFPLSPGQTRNGSTVFGVPLPYLQSVACPADATNPKVQQTFTLPDQTVAQALGLSGPVSSAGFQVSGRDGIGFVHTVVYNGGGSATSPSKSWSGPQFAALLHLPSSDFTFVNSNRPVAGSVGGAGAAAATGGSSAPGASPGSTSSPTGAPRQRSLSRTGAAKGSARAPSGQVVVIETKGIGLDLGMSLNEATAMAGQGKQVNQILSYFYPGASLTSDSKWAASLKST